MILKFKYLFIISILFLTSCSIKYLYYYNDGCSKVSNEDYAGAVEDFSVSIELNNQYWQSYNNRGACYMKLNNINCAIEDFNLAIWINNKNSMAYYNRGICKENCGDTIGALKDYYNVLNNDSSFYIAYTHIARLLANMDSCKKSLDYLNIAIMKNAFDNCNSAEDLKTLKEKLENKCK